MVVAAPNIGDVYMANTRPLVESAEPIICPITEYRVSEVQDSSGSTVAESTWETLFSYSSMGVLTVNSTSRVPIDNYKVFVEVYNTAAWTTLSDYLIDLSIIWVNLGVSLKSPLASTINIEILQG